MKKTNKCLLLALSFTLSASILSACGTPSEEPSSSDSSSAVCQHTYDDACDADCNLCGEERTPSEHVYEDDCDVDCNVCGEERTPSEHVYDDDCDVDCNVCGDVREITHAYDDDCDTECNVCGNPRDAVHTYTKENYDVTHHWNECPDCGTMDETTKEEHEYELDDTDESVDKLICDCDAEASSFNKVVTEQRQQVILSDESVSISLAGVSEYESVVLAMFGEYDLGTDLNALDVSAFKADTANHGEQTIMVIVKDAAGFEHTITVPVFFVTAKLSTAEDWAKVQLTESKGSIYGHYILAEDITLSGTVSSAYASPVEGESYGFKGTLDGNGKTVTFASVGSGGLFGGIGEGAVIKNITFTGTSVNPAYHKSIFGATVLNATFENVTVNVKGDDGNDGTPMYGILAEHSLSGNTCKNFNVVI